MSKSLYSCLNTTNISFNRKEWAPKKRCTYGLGREQQTLSLSDGMPGVEDSPWDEEEREERGYASSVMDLGILRRFARYQEHVIQLIWHCLSLASVGIQEENHVSSSMATKHSLKSRWWKYKSRIQICSYISHHRQ